MKHQIGLPPEAAKEFKKEKLLFGSTAHKYCKIRLEISLQLKQVKKVLIFVLIFGIMKPLTRFFLRPLGAAKV